MSQSTISKQGTRVALDLDWLEKNIRCQHRCPAHMDVPGYIRLINQGRYLESYKLMLETNPFPAVCGYICARPCETKCKRGDFDKPVAIDALKRFVTDYIYKNKIEIPSQKIKKRKGKVAIIGAGPAGLTAANGLAGMGYKVTVFEKESIVGGMMMWAIPSYRLPREQIMFDVNNIKARGVKIKTNTPIGKPGKTISDLLKEGYKAVFIAAGAQKVRKLGIPGEEGDGVMDCLEFLKSVSLGVMKSLGKKVIVVGGGNVAMDTARTAVRFTENVGYEHAEMDAARMAIRLGAREVHVVCLESKEEMPAFEHEIEGAEEEGIILNPSKGPKRIIRENNRVVGLETLDVKSVFDSSGRFNPTFIEGSESTIPSDTVILAVGQTPDASWLEGRPEIELTPRGTIKVDDETLATTRPGVFAGGDVAYGPRIVIEAVADGHKVAKAIDRYIRGENLQEPEKKVWVTLLDSECNAREGNYDAVPRQEMQMLNVGERQGTFNLVELGLTESQAQIEAERCLKCDLNINVATDDCILCGRCSSVCPVDALEQVDVDTGGDYRPHVSKDGIVIRYTDVCIRCGNCKDCPVDAISMKSVFWEPNKEINKLLEKSGVGL
ncbi:MAG: NAD(P) oxidoreductase FAD-containing subunit [Candidatus Scalindua rubra]|uniref:NAD(P) oxidoreductase FAD-containing subunit n=1 Tax=Candidatus Scalindua rubra TaxID=1872076 RepID=A0A1E3XGP5_9BACT|nr:MAG: NAD(P) oxidoreductase FAD-containing subunit [Candidatus Scalindua rubra]